MPLAEHILGRDGITGELVAPLAATIGLPSELLLAFVHAWRWKSVSAYVFIQQSALYPGAGLIQSV